MRTTPQDVMAEIRDVLADIEAVVLREAAAEEAAAEATADEAGDGATLATRLATLRERVGTIDSDLRRQLAQGVRQVDRFVHAHAWQTLGAAATAAFIAGWAMGRPAKAGRRRER